MDRWTWMALRMYAPAALALATAFVVLGVAARWQQLPVLVGLVPLLKWGSLAALFYATLHGAWVTARLWRAERGEGLLCECGGPLGAEINGRYGPYRRCWSCRRNVPCRHYD
ncbi:hypothetical protein H4F99_13355 [Lysobacter sp. SG-8]|uniref:Uncharacterized protein n=1 Tax=Marilutibacter penaei TaxID=2759900 RepID=A0A7W3U699_9GAMM|nr:hypothetical protein [Lysobacter penaei]MBB1089465.1 hypothetical protein [Lysobacter penaei]